MLTLRFTLFECKPELTAILMRLVIDYLAVRVYYRLTDVKAETYTALVETTAFIRFIETVEYMLCILGRYHLTFVIGGLAATSSEVFCAWICPKCFNAIKAMQEEKRRNGNV